MRYIIAVSFLIVCSALGEEYKWESVEHPFFGWIKRENRKEYVLKLYKEKLYVVPYKEDWSKAQLAEDLIVEQPSRADVYRANKVDFIYGRGFRLTECETKDRHDDAGKWYYSLPKEVRHEPIVTEIDVWDNTTTPDGKDKVDTITYKYLVDTAVPGSWQEPKEASVTGAAVSAGQATPPATPGKNNVEPDTLAEKGVKLIHENIPLFAFIGASAFALIGWLTGLFNRLTTLRKALDRLFGKTTGGKISIHDARYGVGADVDDVTKAVTQQVKQTDGVVIADTRALGVQDRHFGQKKLLTIKFTLGGKNKKVEVPEDETCNLRKQKRKSTK